MSKFAICRFDRRGMIMYDSSGVFPLCPSVQFPQHSPKGLATKTDPKDFKAMFTISDVGVFRQGQLQLETNVRQSR
jgi:hypothetical protein